MRQIFPDLWQSSAERPIPNMPNVVSNAYLLTRASGNVLFYNIGREGALPAENSADLSHIDDLGGISLQLLGHWHEASPSLVRIQHQFGSELGVHRDDATRVEAEGGLVPERLFSGRETLLDIDVIPTPGHTAGSVSFLYRSPHGRTYLFTGDTIVPSGNGWTAAPLRESDRTKLRESLTLLGSLKPDVVIAAAAVGTGTLQEVTEESWREAIDGAERSMRRRAA
jgi:hydroxyacylglutathione hydrolase